MFFPIRTDRRLENTPWANYALIASNVIVFTLIVSQQGIPIKYMLSPTDPKLHQFITYQFLHGGWQHIIGNMVFLYVFGNSIEDRLGKVGYLAFYLAGGVIAGVAHCAVSSNPVLGASGSVTAVTGAYLVLFPLTNVTIVYWFLVIGSFEVSSILLILFNIGKDVIFQFMGNAGVAYTAHLAGYAYGFAIGMGLLLTRLLPREPYDLLALIEQRRRQAQFRRTTRNGYQPWQHKQADRPGTSNDRSEIDKDRQEQVLALRQKISQAILQHNLGQAGQLYDELLKIDDSQLMGEQQQLDLANQLMSEGRYDTAAHAYELFLNTYKGYNQREQVELILGLIYVKYLERRQRGHELLTAALPRLHNQQQRQLAENMLNEFG